MDVQIVATHGIAHFLAQQIVVHEGLGGLAAELHHHTGWCVGIHVGVLAGYIIVLDIDDFKEDVASLGLTCHTAGIAVFDICLCHILAGTLHQLVLHKILNVFHCHLALATHGNAVGNLSDEDLILTLGGGDHSLADGCRNLLLIEADDAAVSFNYCLYHIWIVLLIRDHKGIKKRINSKEKHIKILHFEQLLTIQNR